MRLLFAVSSGWYVSTFIAAPRPATFVPLLREKTMQINVAHRALHLVDVERGVSARHHFVDVLVFRSEPLDTNILKSAAGGRFAHLFELRARERLSHKVVDQILPGLHARDGTPSPWLRR